MIDIEAMPYLADIPRVQAERRPDATALWFEGHTTSFAELEKRTNQVANGLLALGIQPGDRIGYLAKNTDVYYEMMFGAAKARAVMNGVNTRLAAPEVKFILSDANAKVLFVGKEFYAMIDQIKAELPDLKRIITLDGDREDWDFYPSWRDSKKAGNPGLRIEGDDDVIQLYTSGTTGLPKGVQLTNDNYLAWFRQASLLEWSSYGAGEAVMNAMPQFHVAGVNVGILGAAQAAKTVILRDIDPQLILKLIPEHRIVHAFWVPAVILMLTQQPNIRETDFSSLKQVFYGASPISEALLRQAVEIMDARFTQLYGLTETVGAGTFLPPEAHDPVWGKLRSCGVPWPGAVVRCVDSAGKPVPTGEVGEIVIKAGFVMKGYWNRAEATKESVRDGFFYTGDAGYFDEDGFLFIHDRVKDMIVSGGENVYPAEVENAIFGAPGVADVAVIGIPDEKWGEAVKAIVVKKPGEDPSADSIIAWAKERIAGYKAPKSVDFVDAPAAQPLRQDPPQGPARALLEGAYEARGLVRMTRYSFAPLVFATCLLAACTVAIDEETVFVPREVESRATDAAALEIPEQASLGATVSHALIAAGDVQIATTHVTREGLDANAPLILVCMGNASDRVRSGIAYARTTMPYGDVLLFDYPGYGDSTGTPTARNLEAIRAPLIDHAEAVAAGRPILLWGHSLGGFVCAQSVRESSAIKGIVLETTAANASEVAASWKPWYMPFLNIRVADTLAGYDTPDALLAFAGPVLVLGAAKDSQLPVELHRSLQGRLKAQGAQVTYLEYAAAEHYDAALQPEFEADSRAFFAAVRAAAD